MSRLISIALAVLGILAGLVFVGCALAARVPRFPRNIWIGYMLGATRDSDEAWEAGHRAAWVPMLTSGIGLVAGGAGMLADLVLGIDGGKILAVVGVVVFLGALLPGAAIAHRAAERVSG